MAMNNSVPKQKLGQLEIELNKISIMLFVLMSILAFTLSVQ
jgi:hypothetical protein